MRNPALSLLFGLAVVALGLGWLYWVFTRFDVGLRLGQTTPVVAVPGFVALALGLWLALRTILLVRLRDALLRNEGALARWQIPASEWEAWRAHDAARSAAGPSLRNKLMPAGGSVPAAGVAVAIGPRAIVVGRAIVPLNVTGFSPFAIWGLCHVGLAEASPASLEFSRYIRGRSGPRVELVRIPLGAAGRPQAQRVLDHFAAAIPERHQTFARSMFPAHFQALEGTMTNAAL
jgi:hypothetical protein